MTFPGTEGSIQGIGNPFSEAELSVEERLWQETLQENSSKWRGQSFPVEIFFISGLIVALFYIALSLQAFNVQDPASLEIIIKYGFSVALIISAVFMSIGLIWRIWARNLRNQIEESYRKKILAIQTQEFVDPLGQVISDFHDDVVIMESKFTERFDKLSTNLNDMVGALNRFRVVIEESTAKKIEQVLLDFTDRINELPEKIDQVLDKKLARALDERELSREAVAAALTVAAELTTVKEALSDTTDSINDMTTSFKPVITELISTSSEFRSSAGRIDQTFTHVKDISSTMESSVLSLKHLVESLEREMKNRDENLRNVIEGFTDTMRQKINDVIVNTGDSLSAALGPQIAKATSDAVKDVLEKEHFKWPTTVVVDKLGEIVSQIENIGEIHQYMGEKGPLQISLRNITEELKYNPLFKPRKPKDGRIGSKY